MIQVTVATPDMYYEHPLIKYSYVFKHTSSRRPQKVRRVRPMLQGCIGGTRGLDQA
jgi:hypothetical protein